MTEYERQTFELLEMAGRFYTNAEAPSEEDMGTVFYYLATRNAGALNKFIESFEEVK